MTLRGDLHCHSTYSDGTCDLWELALFAQIAKLDVLALSDHDTIAGVQKLRGLCGEKGIRVLPAMEISCMDYRRGRMVHMLCYYPGEKTLEIARQTCAMRTQKHFDCLKRLQADYPISVEHVLRLQGESVALYRSHIRRAFEQMGLCMHVDADFMRKIFGKDSRYCAPLVFPDVLDVLDAVKEEGSLAVIAHPGEFDSLELAAELAARGLLHGLEIYHPRNSEETRREALRICVQHGLLTTGGTDFHGANNETLNTLGSYLTPEDSLQRILDHPKAY